MTLNRIYDELLWLYNSSRKEFFPEMVAFFVNWFSGRQHTILRKEDETWKVLASSEHDVDEIDAIQRIVENEYKDMNKDYFSMTELRRGMANTILPLKVRKKTVGLWLMESAGKERIVPEKESLRLSHLVALILKQEQDDKLCLLNRYLDAETNLPGTSYFSQVTERLKKQRYPVCLCLFRIDKYREKLRLYGSEALLKDKQKLLKDIKELDMGNLYIVAEDTFAVITAEKEREAYARIQVVMEQGRGKSLKAVMLNLESMDDVLYDIEMRLSFCNPGIIHVQSLERETSVLPLFDLKEKATRMVEAEEGEEVNRDMGEIQSEEIEEDLLELLERRGKI
ncbi:MAG: hypothetical protein PHW34_09210 [Hespellia sp.]|nr:hypothetical protein [Hespellia sp.]